MSDETSRWFGLHQRLATTSLTRELERLGLQSLALWNRQLDAEDLPAAVRAHLANALADALLGLHERDRGAWDAAIEQLRAALATVDHPLHALLDDLPEVPLRELAEVQRSQASLVRAPPTQRPDLPLALSALLTGSRHSPSLIGQLEKELASADRVDWLVSFIKFSGLKALQPALQRFAEQPCPEGGPRLRVATTSYLGATDLKAVELLLELPNTEVRVSFDTHRTRLHAKAYLFHRKTGVGAAYVGSANISRAALDEGLEWTARISEHELGHVWRQIVASFDTHWCDETEFEPVTVDDVPRIREALNAERQGPVERSPLALHFLDLRPHAFQQAILEDIADERAAGLHRHLVVAATGTGKTMVAAFDYRRFASGQGVGQRPSLLFIAHREEILEQAMQSFRHVLRDASFGDLLVGGRQPTQQRHLFCSVQSWHARSLAELAPEHFDYVVLDEAHHAAADSYQRLLDHLRPRVLLGLTATPERTDGKDIRDDFGRQFTHELRLGDAIEARHLVPFHYFGVSDAPGVDFSGLAWSRGGYRTEDLERVIGSNERRARWVLQQLDEHVADLSTMRALGFCVSRAHANYMAQFFNGRGVPAEVLTAESSDSVRGSARRRLVNREITIIFTVDLFNEGVDIPEVDTVLFLRPTESLTVYLQQLGRGLRLCEGKANLTVLDFIAPQNRRFRFADRFRALSERADLRIDRQIEAGFPWLPAGCLVRLDEQAQATVLANIRDTLAQRRPQIIAQLVQLRSKLGATPTLSQMLDWLHLDGPDLLLKHGMPSSLLGAADSRIAEFESGLLLGLRQLLVAEDREMLLALQHALEGEPPAGDAPDEFLLLGLSLLWGSKRPLGGWREAVALMRSCPGLRADLSQVLAWRIEGLLPVHPRRFTAASGPLALHCCYTSEQILLALGVGAFEKPPSLDGVGVRHIKQRKLDALFVTIDKSEKDFSASTRYEDYAMSPELFHWQSQSRTSAQTPVGQRYINHQSMGYQPLLFVRERKKLPNGLTEPFRYLGPVTYLRHEGSRPPMNIVWRLNYPLHARELRSYQRQVL